MKKKNHFLHYDKLESFGLISFLFFLGFGFYSSCNSPVKTFVSCKKRCLEPSPGVYLFLEYEGIDFDFFFLG